MSPHCKASNQLLSVRVPQVIKNQLQKHRFFLALLGDHAPQALQKLMDTYIGVMAHSYEVDLKTYAQVRVYRMTHKPAS